MGNKTCLWKLAWNCLPAMRQAHPVPLEFYLVADFGDHQPDLVFAVSVLFP
jgi:hypothetical protein